MKLSLNHINLSVWLSVGRLLLVVALAGVGQAQAVDPQFGKGHEVVLTVSVANRYGLPITGLKPEHFSITSDKQPLKISNFSDKDEPASIVFLIDTSGAMKMPDNSNMLVNLVGSIKNFLELSNQSNEYAILRFGTESKLFLDWTTDHRKVVESLNGLVILQGKGLTALYDACRQGMELANRGKYQKRIIILLSDCSDNASKNINLRKLKEEMRANEVIFYGISSPAISDFSSVDGQSVLEDLAKYTGGLALFPQANWSQVDGMFEALIRTLRNQYTVTVQVPQALASRKWHPIKVEIKLPPDALRELKSPVVRHRAGYFDRAGEP